MIYRSLPPTGLAPVITCGSKDLSTKIQLIRKQQLRPALSMDCSDQLKWPSGVVASFAAGYLTPSGMAPRGFDRTEVFGEGWSARISPNPRPIEVWDEKAHWPMPLEIRTDAAGPTGMMAEEQRCFCRVVRGELPVPAGATYHDGLQVQQWLARLAECAN